MNRLRKLARLVPLLGLTLLASLAQAREGGTGVDIPEPTPPLRTVKFKYVVKKSTFERLGTDYSWREEEVCSGLRTLDVYDLRTNDSINMSSQYYECPAKLGGNSVLIGLGGVVTLERMMVFPGEPATDVKAFNSYLYVSTTKAIGPIQEGVQQTSWSRDLSQRTAGLVLRPPAWIICSSTSEPSPNPAPPNPPAELLRGRLAGGAKAALTKHAFPLPPERFDYELRSESGTAVQPGQAECATNLPEFFWAVVEFED